MVFKSGVQLLGNFLICLDPKSCIFISLSKNLENFCSARWGLKKKITKYFFEKWFLGSGPEGADDLCFHTGEISPPPYPPSSSSVPPPGLHAQNQPLGSNPSLEAQIPASRPKFQPQGPNSSLRTQISASRPKA